MKIEKMKRRMSSTSSLSFVGVLVHKAIYFSFFILCFSWLTGCADEVHYSDDPQHVLVFSADTIAFDTLFTDVGSATGVFQVYNPNKVNLQLPDVHLAGGWKSPFRVNVDGQYGVQFSDVDLRAGDSLFVFVEVTVDSSEAETPFEISDSIVFTLASGIQERVLLTASGWNAIPLRGVTLTSDTCYTSRKPYIVYDSLVVASGATLTLTPSTGLYFHDKAYLRVDGTLRAMGTPDSMVLFRGDRLDNMFSYLPYDNVRGQWGGIVFGPQSSGNVLVSCDIHGAQYGLLFESPDTLGADVHFMLSGTIVHNVEGNGLKATLCTGSAVNCQFTNAGENCVDLLGGNYDFIHCTLANCYSKIALRIRNIDDENVLFPMWGSRFVNCIITGIGDDVIEGTMADHSDSLDLSSYAQYAFSHSLINSSDQGNPHFTDIIWESPDSTVWGEQNFKITDHQTSIYDFHLDSLSRARGIADPAWLPVAPYDLEGIERDSLQLDAGCYQYRPAVADESAGALPYRFL